MTSRAVVSTHRLRVVSDDPRADDVSRAGDVSTAKSSPLGVLSIHLDGEVCRVGCEFCYLGQRAAEAPGALDLGLIERALGRLDYSEVAVALSEPATDGMREALRVIRRAVDAAGGGRQLSVTTTRKLAMTPGLLDGVDRVNLSVDPHKGSVSARAVTQVARPLKRAGAEVVLIVSLTTPEFAARLIDGGLLETLVDLPDIDKVALNALKPPPAWCGRQFWMKTLARLAPLLERALDRRLFLDCWVAARLLHLGGCPARADLTPAAAGLAFRSCVYQPAPDFIAAAEGDLVSRLSVFTPPAVCPFPIPE